MYSSHHQECSLVPPLVKYRVPGHPRLAVRAIELDSSSVELSGMLFGGLRSAHYTGGIPDLAFLDRFCAEGNDRFKILLSHHPEYYPSYIRERAEIDLTLAGHAHGGQWCILGRGIFAPGQGLFPKYTHGLYDGGRLAVSRGMHNSIKIPRIFCPTEILYLLIGQNLQKSHPND